MQGKQEHQKMPHISVRALHVLVPFSSDTCPFSLHTRWVLGPHSLWGSLAISLSQPSEPLTTKDLLPHKLHLETAQSESSKRLTSTNQASDGHV